MDHDLSGAEVIPMKIAIPVSGGRVSTVFDVADEIILVEGEPGDTHRRRRARLSVNDRSRKAVELVNLGVEVLICGAVSKPLENMIDLAGIKLISFVRGNVEDILKAYYQGCLEDPCYALPGCRHRRRLRTGERHQAMTRNLNERERKT